MANNNKKNRPKNNQEYKQPSQESAPVAKVEPTTPEPQQEEAQGSKRNGLIVAIIVALLLLGLLGILFIAATLNNGRSDEDTDNSDSVAAQESDQDQSEQDVQANADPEPTPDQELTPETEPEPTPETEPEVVSETESEPAPETTTQPEQSTDGNEVTDGGAVSGTQTSATYTYTTQPGESVSLLARKAMDQYLSESGGSLDRGQRLFFEVTLKNIYGAVPLEIGQVVNFSAADVVNTYQQAVNLSDSTLGAWTDRAISVGYF